MRKILKTSILILALCFCALAQTNNTASCPTISVTGPPGIAQPNEPVLFTAAVDEKAKNYNIKYVWTISSGKIVGGQGTATLSVLPNPGESVTAAIEILGLPEGCSNVASENLPFCGGIPIIIIDEFSASISQIDSARIEAIVSAVKNDPNAQLYIVSTFKHKISAQNINKKHKEIADVLTKTGIEKDRITFIYGFADANLTKVVLVPAGANPPTIEDK